MNKFKLWWRYIKKVINILLTKGYQQVYPPEDAADLTYETDTIKQEKAIIKTEINKEDAKPTQLLHIILDAGHGPTSAGKRSPYYKGKQFLEWEFNLDVINRITSKLDELGIPFTIVNKELEKLGCTGNCLKKRVDFINSIKLKSDKFPIVISQHANAWGSNWNTASGSEVWVYNDITSKNNIRTILAECFLKHYLKELGTRNRGIKMKKTKQFYILKKTKYLSFLLEPGFYTNLNEMKLLDSENGREIVANCAIEAIQDINRVLTNNPNYIKLMSII